MPRSTATLAQASPNTARTVLLATILHVRHRPHVYAFRADRHHDPVINNEYQIASYGWIKSFARLILSTYHGHDDDIFRNRYFRWDCRTRAAWQAAPHGVRRRRWIASPGRCPSASHSSSRLRRRRLGSGGHRWFGRPDSASRSTAASRPPAGIRTTSTAPPDSLTCTDLRALVDAVVVGVGTALADDPQLTVRRVAGAEPSPGGDRS